MGWETTSIPAPAYEAPKISRAVLAEMTLEFGNSDTGAMSPAIDPLATAERADIARHIPLDMIVDEAEAAAIPDPMIALVPPLEPELLTSPEANLMIAYQLPLEIILPSAEVTAGVEPNTDVVMAFAPRPLPAPAAFRDRTADAMAEALSANALVPFVAPAPPAQPRVAASGVTEELLTLARAERIDVQRRLALAGFDPNGFDGVFGPRTRGALADFQTAWGFPATGYLEASVYADLNQRTEDAYQALRRQAAAAPSAAPKLAPIARERQFASADQGGRCARRSDGKIIERQGLACDLAGFGEKFVSLGRNTLGYEADNAPANAANAPISASAGADR